MQFKYDIFDGSLQLLRAVQKEGIEDPVQELIN